MKEIAALPPQLVKVIYGYSSSNKCVFSIQELNVVIQSVFSIQELNVVIYEFNPVFTF